MFRLTCILLLVTASTVQGQDAESEIRVFELRYVQSSETGPLLSQMFDNVVITGDERTNSIIVRGGGETMQEIEALLKKLDVPVAPAAAMPSNSQYARALGTYSALFPKADPPSPQKTEYERLEREIAQLAEVCRRLANEQNSVSQQRRDQLALQLKEKVAKAFQLRQEVRRENIHRLRERLEQVESTLNQRENARDQIIEGRVASLLDADQDAIAQQSVPGYANRPQFPRLPGSLPGPLGLPGPPATPRLHGGSGIAGPEPDTIGPSLAPLASPNSQTPPVSSDGHLDLVRAAERCRDTAAGPDFQRLDRAVTDYRSVERRFKTYVELATIELQAAEANLEQLKNRQQRLESLYKSGVTSSEEFEKAHSQAQSGEFAVQLAKVTKEFYDQLLKEAQTMVAEAIETAKGNKAEASEVDKKSRSTR